jgi:hypothetical protein
MEARSIRSPARRRAILKGLMAFPIVVLIGGTAVASSAQAYSPARVLLDCSTSRVTGVDLSKCLEALKQQGADQEQRIELLELDVRLLRERLRNTDANVDALQGDALLGGRR